MIRILTVVFAALILAPTAGSAAMVRDEVSTYTLDNGLEVVVIEDHRAPVATQMVWYRVGAADDPAGKSGLAHLLEHLMFKGTEKHGPGEFSRLLAENGGDGNAMTSFDYTAYFQTIAVDRLDLVMELESDRMRNLDLPADVVAPERDVVLEERNQRIENDPGAVFAEQRAAALYLNHPYGRPAIGWRQELAALTREDALDFYRTYYAPNNAILVVAGDVEPEAVHEMAQKYYGPIEPSDDLPPRTRPQEPPQLAARRMSYADPRVRQPYVVREYLAPVRSPGEQDRAAALSVLARLLGGGITSHLVQSLQYDEKVAIDAGVNYGPTAVDPHSFTIYAAPAPGVSLEKMEARLDAAIADFIATGPSEDELERVKRSISAEQIYALDSQQRRARRYGGALAVGLTVDDVAAWPEVLESVTAEDVVAAAREVFDLRHSVTGYLTGVDEAPAEDDAEARQ